MLKIWIFIMMIDGKPLEAFPSDSEADCKRKMSLLLALQRESGNTASGACYIKAAEK